MNLLNLGVLLTLLLGVLVGAAQGNLWTQKKKQKEDAAVAEAAAAASLEMEGSSFDSLLKQATLGDLEEGGAGGPFGAGMLDEQQIMEMLQAVSSMSEEEMAEIVDNILETIMTSLQDPESRKMFEDPEQLKELVNSIPPELRGALDLSAFENAIEDPANYKTKMDDTIDNWVAYMTKFREGLKNPAVMKEILRDLIKENGDMHPDTKAVVEKYAEDPSSMLSETFGMMAQGIGAMGGLGAGGGMGGDDMDFLTAMMEDPEFLKLMEDPEGLEAFMEEMMKDPQYASLLEGLDGGAGADYGEEL